MYRVVEYPGADASYPSEASLNNVADCADAGDEFVGAPVAEANLEIFVLYPLEDQWAAGDRTITCTLRRPNGARSLTETQEGKGDDN